GHWMGPKELESYNVRLLDLRRRLIPEVDATEEALRENVAARGELSTVRTHPADQAADDLDAGIAIAQNEERLLEDVEAAITRIEDGTFGLCQNCGRKISIERLNAIPYTALCIDCARRTAT